VMATYNNFNSIEDIQRRGEFFKRGQIIPQRILKCNKRRHAHRKVFGSNSYAIPVNGGYLVACFHSDDNSSAIRILLGMKSCLVLGSPYGMRGTWWVGNYQLSDDDFIKLLNETLMKMTKAGEQ